MYDIRQFKPAVYILLLLGITGYCVSAQFPALWAISCVGVFVHAWLEWRGRFKPMPRLLTNIVTLGSLAYVILDVLASGSPPVLLVGEFLVLLQLVKLWELRSNRDYAQLLVLGLLLMVAAAISTASLWFAVILLLYLLISLYCCLLFQLKVEADAAVQRLGVSAERFSLVTLRQDQRYLPRSIRRLTVVATGVGLAFAVVVFLIFPRGAGGGMLGPIQMKAAQVFVGFSDQVNFQNVAKLQQNNETVAWVALSHMGKPIEGTASLLLRGTTLDSYSGYTDSSENRYQWSRTDLDGDSEKNIPFFTADRQRNVHEFTATTTALRGLDSVVSNRALPPMLRPPLPPIVSPGDDIWEQRITLRPTGSKVLFAMPGVVGIQPHNRPLQISFYRNEKVIESFSMLRDPVEYLVKSKNEMRGKTRILTDEGLRDKLKHLNEIDPRIASLASQAAVSGRDEKGPLADQRKPYPSRADPLDEQIATSIETYLKTHYSYTLDLTDTKMIEGRDPIVAFLTDFKKGHCEYFAGAMTLLCQSLGLQARMVVGFHADPDAYVGGYYLIQQSHAHAWVEVLTVENGETVWKTFDPTSAQGSVAHRLSFWQRTRNLLNFLDFAYARSVVAYSAENQGNVMHEAENKLTKTIIKSSNVPYKLREWLFPVLQNALTEIQSADQFWTIAFYAFAFFMALCLAGAIGWFAWERYRMRRRAARIGIASLPIDQRMRLARQLGFYDELVRLLDRHNMSRPSHQTPMEFGRSLSFLPATAYETVMRLSELFYRVRYGRAEITPARRKHLSVVLQKLAADLDVD